MSKYKRSWTWVTNFEGDTVKMELSGMKRKHLQQLSKYMAPGDDGGMNLSFENQLEAFDAFAVVLPECVSNFRGLVDFDKKQPIPFEVVLEDMYFINLVSEIIEQVMEASTMNTTEVKALKKSQGERRRVLRSEVGMRA